MTGVELPPPLKPEIIWVDIETTGLEALDDVILEVGIRVTNWWGGEIDRFTSLVYSPFWRDQLSTNSFVKVMHEDSGLVRDLTDLEKTLGRRACGDDFSSGAVEAKALAFLEPYVGLGPHHGQFPMSGNSIRFDRAFLDIDMKRLNDWFHYRSHDVSALREECRLSNSTLHGKEPDLPKVHRPQEDITNSIVLRQHFLKNFLWVGEERFIPED